MNNICIIPARGGSKRIPKKNIKSFLGKPIIAYSIEAAIKSNLFSEVMVSTDNNDIVEIAKKYGAKIPFIRSKKNSDDFATTFDVITEVLNEYKKNEFEFDNVCCIYACAPFVNGEKIIKAYNKLLINKFDTVFPIMEYSFPIQRAVKKNNNNKLEMFDSKYLSSRSQDLEKSYHDAGQFYWMNTQNVLKKKSLFTNNTGALVISEMEGQDIDNLSDWKLAEMKYKLL